MGFTRYYVRTNKSIPDDMICDIKNALNIIQKEYHIDICGPKGYGEPYISASDGICFNGNAEKMEDFETFSISSDTEHEKWKKQYCKTGRQPYDAAVNAITQIAEWYGVAEQLDSDGQNKGTDIIAEKVIQKIKTEHQKNENKNDINIPIQKEIGTLHDFTVAMGIVCSWCKQKSDESCNECAVRKTAKEIL